MAFIAAVAAIISQLPCFLFVPASSPSPLLLRRRPRQMETLPPRVLGPSSGFLHHPLPPPPFGRFFVPMPCCGVPPPSHPSAPGSQGAMEMVPLGPYNGILHPPLLLPLPLLPPPARVDITVSWRPPPDGWIKLNTDGSFAGRESSGGAGFVARDSEGLLIFAGASCCPGVNALYSELWAIRSALTEAAEAGFPRVILESDSSTAVRLLGEGIKNAPRGTKQLVQECVTLRHRFREIIIQFTYREGNRVADRLAALGRSSGQSRFFLSFDQLPDAVTRERIVFDLMGGASVRPNKV